MNGKIRNKKHMCKGCNEWFYNADSKGTYCSLCKNSKHCKICQAPIFYENKRGLCIKHSNSVNKGKTYREMYGDRIPGCGFKKGLLNPNFTEGRVRSRVVSKQSKKNKYGEFYRSIYEVWFSEKLHDGGIDFEYETRVSLGDGKYKLVDFKIRDVLIEISGYAHDGWRNSFDEKITKLRLLHTDPLIIIIPFKEIYNQMYTRLYNLCTFNTFLVQWDMIENDFDYFLQKVKFCQNIKEMEKVCQNIALK